MSKGPKPPQGNFHRGDLMWMPNMLKTVGTFTFTIPHKPFSLNQLIHMKGNQGDAWARAQWSEFKQAWERCVRHYWVTQAHSKGESPPRLPGPYRVRYLYLCKTRRSDPSNLHSAMEKVILDALIEGGALESDGFKHHRGSSYEAEKADKWGIVVTVESI